MYMKNDHTRIIYFMIIALTMYYKNKKNWLQYYKEKYEIV